MAEMTVDLTGARSASIDLEWPSATSLSANFVGTGSESEPLIVKTIAKKITTVSDVILNGTDKKTLIRNINSFMAGYRCVCVSNVSLSNVDSQAYLVDAGEGYNVTIRRRSGTIRATGINTSPSIPYYYTINATLYYLRNDLNPVEVS